MNVAIKVDDRIGQIVTCEGCEHWDEISGLSARMCYHWGRYTTRNDFCSRCEIKQKQKTSNDNKSLHPNAPKKGL